MCIYVFSTTKQRSFKMLHVDIFKEELLVRNSVTNNIIIMFNNVILIS